MTVNENQGGRNEDDLSYSPKVRLYVAADKLAAGGLVALDQKQTHYLRTVLRLAEGAEVALFNGRDGEWRAHIETLAKKSAGLRLMDRAAPQETPPDLWLCFAPVKKNRIDYLIEKATELGVKKLIPVITERTVVGRVNLDRLAAHIVEAAEQCGRTHVPRLEQPVKLPHLLGDWPADRALMYCDEMMAGGSAIEALRQDQRPPASRAWAILTGPEGGFSPRERQMALGHPKTVAVHLGPRILRADTAALAAITLWQAALGDW